MKYKVGVNVSTARSFLTSPYPRELCVTNAGRRSVRRDSSLQQLSLRMTPADAHFFCVILSAAKDLARQRVSRQHQHTVCKALLILGEVAASIGSGGRGYSEFRWATETLSESLQSSEDLSLTLSLDKERGLMRMLAFRGLRGRRL
jgi:hypothetical protein